MGEVFSHSTPHHSTHLRPFPGLMGYAWRTLIALFIFHFFNFQQFPWRFWRFRFNIDYYCTLESVFRFFATVNGLLINTRRESHSTSAPFRLSQWTLSYLFEAQATVAVSVYWQNKWQKGERTSTMPARKKSYRVDGRYISNIYIAHL